MLLSDIKTAIGSRVGDKNLDTYADVVQGYFAQAMSALIKMPKSKDNPAPFYEDEMLPLLAKLRKDISLLNGIGEYTLNESNLAYVYGVTTALGDSYINFKLISSEEIRELALKLEMDGKEGRWAKDGKTLSFMAEQAKSPIGVFIKIVNNPNSSAWEESTDFASYGAGFIWDCIEFASKKLKTFIERGE